MIVHLPIRHIWITSRDGDSLTLRGYNARPSETSTSDAEVRDYAGRRRIISSVRHTETIPLQATFVSPDDLMRIRAWRGTPLLLRSDVWRRWGTYTSVVAEPVDPYEAPDRYGYRVSLNWTDIDVDESV